jgi:hypothetical protein
MWKGIKLHREFASDVQSYKRIFLTFYHLITNNRYVTFYNLITINIFVTHYKFIDL